MRLSDSVLVLAAGNLPDCCRPANRWRFRCGWHIILACFGVAFPTMIFVMHRRGIVRDDPDALRLARRWAKVSAVLFAIGAVSGTVLSFEMGLLWPGLMGRFGDVLGLGFALEGLSFFVEAIFLGLYLYGWGRMPPRRHLAMLIPMAMSGIVGSFCVVSVNAWMNDPTGFTIRDGIVTDINPWAAMFNDLVWLQFLRMWVGAFMLVGLVVCGGVCRRSAARAHRRPSPPRVHRPVRLRQRRGHRPAVDRARARVAGRCAPDRQAGGLRAGPAHRAGPAPERLGGVLVDGEVRWALPIPWIGSFIARGSFDAPVPGLDTIPQSDWPPVNLTHLSFQLMVAIGMLLALVVVVFWLARRRGHDLLGNRWYLRFCVIAGPLAILALELGWIATEVGRQPWTVWQVLRATDAASIEHGIVVELHRRADRLPRHDGGGVCRSALDGAAMARR